MDCTGSGTHLVSCLGIRSVADSYSLTRWWINKVWCVHLQFPGQHLITALADIYFNYPTTSWWLGEEESYIEFGELQYRDQLWFTSHTFTVNLQHASYHSEALRIFDSNPTVTTCWTYCSLLEILYQSRFQIGLLMEFMDRNRSASNELYTEL
jgi:hypothetical protein